MPAQPRIARVTFCSLLTLPVWFPLTSPNQNLAIKETYLVAGAVPAEAHVVGLSYADITLEERSVRMTLRIAAKGLAEHFQLKLKVEKDPPTGAEVLRVGGDILVPLASVTLSRALRGRFDKHARLARWTLPLWFYVSVTGVVLYWMLYHLYPARGH